MDTDNMIMNLMRTLIFSACTAIALTTSAATKDDGRLKLDCADPVNSGRHVVKETVGPIYVSGADDSQLKTAAAAMDSFVTGAAYCQMELQSRPEKVSSDLIAEWRSLNQWLNRLADRLDHSVIDPSNLGWRDEYSLFAEVYEFEP